MRTYETTFIVNPQSDDTAIDDHVQAVIDVITNNGGKMIRENRIGTRRLAYEIQKLSQGYYTDLIFEAPASTLRTLDRFYKLEEPYIRHLTVRFEDKIPPIDETTDSAPGEDLKEDKEKGAERGRRAEPPVVVDETKAEEPAEVEPVAARAESTPVPEEPVVEPEKTEPETDEVPSETKPESDEVPSETKPESDEGPSETKPDRPAGDDDIL